MRSVGRKMGAWTFALLFSLVTLLSAHGEQCGSQARGALCPGGLCCSQYGWCGTTTTAYCGDGCQSQCGMGSMPTTGPPNVTGVDSIITQAILNQILTHRNEAACPGKNFYTYNGFISAANFFSGFGTTGDLATRKRELAAFLAQTSRETTDTTISFKMVIWFWMTPQSPKPSPHDVMTGRWKPSCADVAAGRQSGFGVVTNIINGRHECGKGIDSRVADRIGFYKRYCDLLGVSYGANLDSYNQRPFSSSLTVAL